MSTDGMQKDGNGWFFLKDPRAKLPVKSDWTTWLTQEGTTIVSSTWTAETAGLTLSGSGNTAQVSSVTIEGGTAGATYVLRNTITCANGQIDSRSLRVVVKDR